MTETVLVTPRHPRDANGDEPAAGSPYSLTPLAVAPGFTNRRFGDVGDVDEVAFTVYLALADEAKIADNYGIRVRGRDCLARVQVWRSPWSGRGGVVVLAKTAAGVS